MDSQTSVQLLLLLSLSLGCTKDAEVEDSPTDTSQSTETGELEGCAAVPVCRGDPDCHFMVGEVDGLAISCSNDSGAWMLSVQATGLPQHA